MIKVTHEVVNRLPDLTTSRPHLPITSLIADLSSPKGDVRDDARRALAAYGKDAVNPLIELLSSQDAHTRWEAAKALGEIKGKDAALALSSALNDEHRDVRWVAAEGLSAIGRDAIVPVLEELISHADSVGVRSSASHVLGSLVGEEGTLHAVLSALNSSAPIFDVPVAAFEVLRALRNRSRPSSSRSQHR
jgi:HEAT repeat protein